jgi:hypothetical protein
LVTEANPGPLDNEAIKRLFERVIDEARRIERIHAEKQQGDQAALDTQAEIESTILNS